MGAVQRLLQVSGVEPYRRERPPRQGDGDSRAGQRFLDCRFPGLDRLQQSAPQRVADEWRQQAALQHREHPIDARSGRDELAHGRESRTAGLTALGGGRGCAAIGQLDGDGRPRCGVVEQFERPRLFHHPRTTVGHQVGQVPPSPLLSVVTR